MHNDLSDRQLSALQREVAAWQRRADLFDETALSARAEALDFLNFVDTLLRETADPSVAHVRLSVNAAHLATQLTAVNQRLFQQLRQAIQQQRLTGAALRHYCTRFIDSNLADDDGQQANYDGLDLLIDGLFALAEAPAPTVPPMAEMVHCEETPASVMLALVDQIDFGPTDRFYDLGCGLGQVVMLVHLLTGVPACGVEIEPAFVAFAREQAATLGLRDLHFITGDLQVVDLQEGTVFFLFTPVRGQRLQRLLARLRAVAVAHPIRVCTFGPCTPIVGQEHWLRARTATPLHPYKLAIFDSL